MEFISSWLYTHLRLYLKNTQRERVGVEGEGRQTEKGAGRKREIHLSKTKIPNTEMMLFIQNVLWQTYKSDTIAYSDIYVYTVAISRPNTNILFKIYEFLFSTIIGIFNNCILADCLCASVALT